MNTASHEQELRRLGARRRRAEAKRAEARRQLAAGVRAAVAAGMTQHAAARAAGITQGLVWQYLDKAGATTKGRGMNAAEFARGAGVDQYSFRRWLRSNGVRVGKGNEHDLPKPSSPEGRDLIERYKANGGRWRPRC